MKMKDFRRACSTKILTDFDGYAKLATINEMSDIIITPSELLAGNVIPGYDYIVWFSKR